MIWCNFRESFLLLLHFRAQITHLCSGCTQYTILQWRTVCIAYRKSVIFEKEIRPYSRVIIKLPKNCTQLYVRATEGRETHKIRYKHIKIRGISIKRSYLGCVSLQCIDNRDEVMFRSRTPCNYFLHYIVFSFYSAHRIR